MHRAGLILPPIWMLVITVLVYAVAAIPYLCLRWTLGELSDPDEILLPQRVIVWTAAVLYSVYRVVTFHPVFHKDYMEWLGATPWRHPNPLPMGPIHFEWPDLLILVTLCVASGTPEITAALFLMAYLAASVGVFFLCDLRWPGYWLLFVLSLVVWLASWHLHAALFAGLAAYILAQWLHQITLTHFPWPEAQQRIACMTRKTGLTAGARRSADYVGWPFCELHGHAEDSQLGRAERIAIIVIAVSWSHTLLAFCDEPTVAFEWGSLVTLIAAGALGVARLTHFLPGHAPSLDMLGRLGRGGILRGYDQIFFAPFAMTLAALLLPQVLRLLPVESQYGFPVVLAVVLSIGMFVGPSLRTWKLTGDHRLVPMVGKRAEMEKL